MTHNKHQILSILLLLSLAFTVACKDNFRRQPIKLDEKVDAKEESFDSETESPENISSVNTPVFIPMSAPRPKGKRSSCGDGVLNSGEDCDDHNRKSNDGCSSTCHFEENFPLCHWQCDDPLCPAICDPVCEPPLCSNLCEELDAQPNCQCEAVCEPPQCEIKCEDVGCPVESCPQCTTQCLPPVCETRCTQINPSGPTCTLESPVCSAQCEEVQCSWKCHKPLCPEPQCELVCGQAQAAGCKVDQ